MSWSREYGISREAWEKFDDYLRRAVINGRENPEQELPVMIVLTGDTERTQTATSTRLKGDERAKFVEEQSSSFERKTHELLNQLTALKANDIKTFWINSTVSAKLPIRTLDEIGRREDIKQMMLVRRQKVTT